MNGSLDLTSFHNALRILLNLDQDQLVAAGVLPRENLAAWKRFQDDPYRWFIRADDATAQKLWALMQTRTK